MRTGIQAKIYTGRFIVALCIIAKNWKCPRCPSTDEQFNEMWYIHLMEYCWAIKIDEVWVPAPV